MTYKVIHNFQDLQDFNHSYKVGDSFPRLGLNVSQSRLDELSSNKNKQGKPLIEKVEEIAERKKYTKTEINRMPIAELRKIALEIGLEDSENMTGAELKKSLIQVLEV